MQIKVVFKILVYRYSLLNLGVADVLVILTKRIASENINRVTGNDDCDEDDEDDKNNNDDDDNDDDSCACYDKDDDSLISQILIF